MKKIFFFVAALAATMMAQATVFVDETFTDFPGTAWNASGSVTTGTGRTQDAALTYSDGGKTWVLSGKGNSVKTDLDASSNYQHTKSLPANITSDYYVAFMLRADGQQKQAQTQVFGLGSPSLGARVWLGKGQMDATKCRLGVTRSSGTNADVQWAASEFATDQTMLVVLKYTMTATDTIASIYVNPAIGGTEPATPLVLDNLKGANKCKKSVSNMTFYTTSSNKSHFTVGGVRVCTDWAEAVAEATPAINYWLVGSAAESGWDQTAAMPMPGDSIVRHLAAGTYEFKVLTTEGSWTGALGYANLNTTASSANVFGDDNVVFELENEDDVTIKVVDGQIVVLGTFKEQVEADYYIKFAGNNWTWVGMTQAPSGYYMYEGVWGGVGANVNTSMSDNGASWFPEADIMFLDESMEEMPVPAVGTEGIYVYMQYAEPVLAFVYEGTPTALENVETVKAVKVIENGQVVIIRDGVRYNALGAKL